MVLISAGATAAVWLPVPLVHVEHIEAMARTERNEVPG